MAADKRNAFNKKKQKNQKKSITYLGDEPVASRILS